MSSSSNDISEELQPLMGSLPDYISSIEIETIDLPKRLMNVLKSHDIETVGEFLQINPLIMVDLKNLGEDSKKTIFMKQNLLLKHLLGIQPSEKVHQIQDISHESDVHDYQENGDQEGNIKENLDKDQDFTLDIPVEYIGLTDSKVKILNQDGIQTFDDLRGYSKADLKKLDNIGSSTADDLLDELEYLESVADVIEEKIHEFKDLVNNLPSSLKSHDIAELPLSCRSEECYLTLEEFQEQKGLYNLSVYKSVFLQNGDIEKQAENFSGQLRKLNRVDDLSEYWDKQLGDYLDFVLSLFDKRTNKVLEHLYGFKDPYEKTLEETATIISKEDQSLSRERPRQIKNDAIELISKPFYKELLEPILFHVNELIRKQGGITSNNSFKEIHAEDRWGEYRVNGIVNFLSQNEFIHEIEIGNISLILHRDINEEFIKSLCKALKNTLHEEIMNLESISSHLQPEFSDEELENLNELGLDIETVIEKLISHVPDFGTTPFDKIGLSDWRNVNPKTSIDWAYTILNKLWKPMHWTDILSTAEKYSSQEFNRETFYNTLSMNDDIFTRFDEGTYGLVEMESDYSTDSAQTITELNYKTLKEHGTLTFEEIASLVQENKDCSKSSVKTFLKGDPRIISEDDFYQLREDHEELGHFSTSRGPYGGRKPQEQIQLAKSVIRDYGEPIYIDDLCYRMSKKADSPFHSMGLEDTLAESEKIVSVGQRYFALKDQGYEELTPVEALIKYFENKGEAKKGSDVIKGVQRFRKLGDSTVYMILKDNDQFQKTADGKYELVKEKNDF